MKKRIVSFPYERKRENDVNVSPPMLRAVKVVAVFTAIFLCVALTACNASNEKEPEPNSSTEIDSPDNHEIKLPEFYSDTNLHEIVEAYLWDIGEQNAEYKDSKVCSIEEIESITVSKDRVIKSFKVGLMNPEKRIHYYYYSVPVADTNASYPVDAFDRTYITVGETFDSDSIKEFYNQYYSDIFDIFKLYFERNYDDLKQQIETAAGHTVNKLSYEGFYPIYEGGCVPLSDGNEYHLFDGRVVSSSFEPFISDYRGSTPCGSVKTAEEAVFKIRFNLDDVDAAIRFDPYGYFMAKGASNYFFGRNEYYEGKSPNLGADYITGGTKTIYNVFKKEGTYIKTVALKDAGTYRGLRIGDDKSRINELYPEIHTEAHPAIEENREYYWYSKNPETSGSVLIIIVQNGKVSELQSVYVESELYAASDEEFEKICTFMENALSFRKNNAYYKIGDSPENGLADDGGCLGGFYENKNNVRKYNNENISDFGVCFNASAKDYGSSNDAQVYVHLTDEVGKVYIRFKGTLDIYDNEAGKPIPTEFKKTEFTFLSMKTYLNLCALNDYDVVESGDLDGDGLVESYAYFYDEGKQHIKIYDYYDNAVHVTWPRELLGEDTKSAPCGNCANMKPEYGCGIFVYSDDKDIEGVYLYDNGNLTRACSIEESLQWDVH